MRKNNSSAFTLIELLIVITIIAVLASIALPAYNGIQERANQTKDLSNGKQIALALKLFASDNNGAYPSKIPTTVSSDYASAAAAPLPSNSNDCFWWLFPSYLQSEDIFVVSGSKWTPSSPDNVLDPATAATRDKTLHAGENNFAYVAGLTDTANSSFPLLADGFSASVGTYSPNKSVPGGVWGGKKAIVIFCDASGQIMKANSAYKIPRPAGSSTPDYFTGTSDGTWIDTTNNPVLNPVAP